MKQAASARLTLPRRVAAAQTGIAPSRCTDNLDKEQISAALCNRKSAAGVFAWQKLISLQAAQVL
jgi:hypothetical protein